MSFGRELGVKGLRTSGDFLSLGPYYLRPFEDLFYFF